ncbi:MAG: DoxX family protein [Actinomycetia bacterium]|nr:DoxX family protein [Actinomycetes bacterium]
MSATVETVLLVATVACVVANTFEVAAKVCGARFVVQNSAEVGVDRTWIPYLAVIEGSGVAGLLLGLFHRPALGLAAAVGLLAFFVLAVLAHVRSRVLHNIAFPATFLVLAAAAVGYFAGAPG